MDTPTEAELAALRADLAEARADVQRFEAQLAAANRDLAQARAERDAEQKRRVFAEEGEENLRFLKKLWENESGFYLRKSHDRYLTIERQRRTIRALVVACRAMDCVGFTKMGQVRWYAAVRGEVKRIERGQQAGE